MHLKFKKTYWYERSQWHVCTDAIGIGENSLLTPKHAHLSRQNMKKNIKTPSVLKTKRFRRCR